MRLSASKWRYEDLKFLQIFYDDKPTPFDEFVEEVKSSIDKDANLTCPDTSRVISFSKAFLKETIRFSIDRGELRRLDKLRPKRKVTKKIGEQTEEIQKDLQRIRDGIGKLDIYNLFYTGWSPVMMNFVRQVTHLIKDEDFLLGNKRKARQERGGKKNQGEPTSMQKDERFFQNLWEFFGQIFFLTKGYLPKRDFHYRKTPVSSIPDFIYVLEMKFSAETSDESVLFFIPEVKKFPVKRVDADVSIEVQVDNKVLGQVGSELLAEAKRSLFWPRSLGILVMETKLIFVFLKISEEHYDRIAQGKDILEVHGPGKISYSEPFDMLIASDRDKMADLLFWLGCVQDPLRYEFL